MGKVIAIFFLVIGSSLGQARSCDDLMLDLKQRIYSNYQIDQRRSNLLKVRNFLYSNETRQFINLSSQFKSLPTNADIKKFYILQYQAKLIVRDVVQRAGYEVLNPIEGSPFDALIEEVSSADGFAEYGVEVRSLLIRIDPLPRITLWLYRADSAHNPWGMISVDILPDANQDLASWRGDNGIRVSGSVNQFIEHLLPVECRF